MQTRWLTFSLLFSGCFYVSPEEHAARWDVDGDGIERPEDCDDKDKDVQDLTWYTDLDGDGFGDPETGVSECEPLVGAVSNGDDCDDSVATTNPGASELCNGIDDNCNELVDEDDDLVPTWFEDADGDGFGDVGSEVSACSQPTGYVDRAGDCNDDLANGGFDINPDAEDICDGVDNDCSGEADDDEAYWVDWYVDGDLDGFGDENAMPTVHGCEGGAGDVADATDCDDLDPLVNPDPLTLELCDGIDNNCDGNTDDPTSDNAIDWYLDADGDGYGFAGDVLRLCTCSPAYGCYRIDNFVDCDDSDPEVHPQHDEICLNLIDDNCDTNVDEAQCTNECDTGDTGC